MRIVSLAEIEPVTADKAAVVESVRQGFIRHARGAISLPPPVQMIFHGNDDDLRGDCHVKCAYSDDYPFYCVKIASGFYDNAARGLPVNNGMLLLISSETGEPLALFQDGGHLTSVRTAAAGALAVELTSGPASQTLGIVGTGHQATLQARWISGHVPISRVVLWGRSRQKADLLAEQLQDLAIPVSAVDSREELCEQADVIVTTTPSTRPVLSGKQIRPGHNIVALGADSPGKVELDPAILARAESIVTDDHEQCLHHGEFGHAVRAGMVDAESDLSLGELLAQPDRLAVSDSAIAVVDLTGLGAQDLAIATLAWEAMSL